MADTRYNVTSGFFNSVGTDRTYSADDMNRVTARLTSEGIFTNANGGVSTDFLVTAGSGLNISVAPGEARMSDKWVRLASAITVPITANTESSTRIDSIILQLDDSSETRAAAIIYRTGTAGTGTPPDLSQSLLEFRLANVSVSSGATSVTVVDNRGEDDCPWIEGLLYSGKLYQIQVGEAQNSFNIGLLENSLSQHKTANVQSFAAANTRMDNLFAKLAYTRATVESYDFVTGGYIYDSKQKIHFCVTLPKYCDSADFNISLDLLSLRVYQNGTIVLGDASTRVPVQAYTTITNKGSFIFCEVQMPQAIPNAINRAECGIIAGVTVRITPKS